MQSVIVRVITKSGGRIAGINLFITSMITDRTGRHEVLLPIILIIKITISEKNKNSQVGKVRENVH